MDKIILTTPSKVSHHFLKGGQVFEKLGCFFVTCDNNEPAEKGFFEGSFQPG